MTTVGHFFTELLVPATPTAPHQSRSDQTARYFPPEDPPVSRLPDRIIGDPTLCHQLQQAYVTLLAALPSSITEAPLPPGVEGPGFTVMGVLKRKLAALVIQGHEHNSSDAFKLVYEAAVTLCELVDPDICGRVRSDAEHPSEGQITDFVIFLDDSPVIGIELKTPTAFGHHVPDMIHHAFVPGGHVLPRSTSGWEAIPLKLCVACTEHTEPARLGVLTDGIHAVFFGLYYPPQPPATILQPDLIITRDVHITSDLPSILRVLVLALLRPSFIKEPLSFTATTPPNTLKTFVSSNSYSAPPAKSTRSGAGTGASGGGGSGSSSGSGGFGAGPNARGFSGQQWAAVGGWGDAQVSYSSRFRPSGRTEGWRPANGWLQNYRLSIIFNVDSIAPGFTHLLNPTPLLNPPTAPSSVSSSSDAANDASRVEKVPVSIQIDRGPVRGAMSRVFFGKSSADHPLVVKLANPGAEEDLKREVFWSRVLEGVQGVLPCGGCFENERVVAAVFLFGGEPVRDFARLSDKLKADLLALVQRVHAAGVRHGDLHASNILCLGGTTLHIIDFGQSSFAPAGELEAELDGLKRRLAQGGHAGAVDDVE